MSNSEKTVKRRASPSEEQKLYVVEFLEKHPYLVSQRRNWEKNLSAQHRLDLWEELTETLNSMGYACKTVEAWRVFWKDQRRFVKERYAAYMRSCKTNVRALHDRVRPLNDYENRVLALLNPDYKHWKEVDPIKRSRTKIKLEEEEDDDSQLENMNQSSISSFNQLSSPVHQPSSPSPSPPPSPPPSPRYSPQMEPRSFFPNIKIKSIRSLLQEEQDDCYRNSGKRIKLEKQLEEKTLTLLERNEEFNREMEIKKLEVEKEKVAALNELIIVLREGFACIAAQYMK